MGRTKIEWASDVWNPIVGCSRVDHDTGCKNCYAARIAHRLGGNPRTPQYKWLTHMVDDAPHGCPDLPPEHHEPRWTGEIRFVQKVLKQPLRWKKPRRIFVCSMGDLFHENVDDELLLKVFDIVYLCAAYGYPHTFLLLTKRPERMLEFFTRIRFSSHSQWGKAGRIWLADDPDERCGLRLVEGYPSSQVVNFHLGVSASTQEELDRRVPVLLETPAAVRFVSLEPLLGPVLVERYLPRRQHREWRCGRCEGLNVPKHAQRCRLRWLSGVIVGGETGPGARPMKPGWVRSIRDQCAAAGVPFFFKGWGEWAPMFDTLVDEAALGRADHHVFDDGKVMYRVGKKAAGRLLDGVEHNELPGGDTDA